MNRVPGVETGVNTRETHDPTTDQENTSLMTKAINFGHKIMSACSTVKRWTWSTDIRKGITLIILSLALIYFGRAYLLGIPPRTMVFNLFSHSYKAFAYTVGGTIFLISKCFAAVFKSRL